MSESLTLYQAAPIAPRRYEPEEIALFSEAYAKGCTPTEVKLAVAVAEQLGLSLLSRQIYALKRWDGLLQKEVMQIQVGIDGFRSQADRTGLWAGYDPPRWMDEAGKWHTDWLDAKRAPYAASVTVYRHGFTRPVEAKVYFSERAQTKKDGSLTAMWKTKPLTMLGKCALAEALRGAFPTHLGGVYAPEELPAPDGDMIEGEVVSTRPAIAAPAPPPPPEKSSRARTKKDAEPAKSTSTAALPVNDHADAFSAFYKMALATDGILGTDGKTIDKDLTRAAVVARLKGLWAKELIPVDTFGIQPTEASLATFLGRCTADEIRAITATYRQTAEAESQAPEPTEVETTPATSPAEQAVGGMFDGLPE